VNWIESRLGLKQQGWRVDPTIAAYS